MHGLFETIAKRMARLGLQGQVNYGKAPDCFLSVNKEKEAMFQVTTGHDNAYKGHYLPPYLAQS